MLDISIDVMDQNVSEICTLKKNIAMKALYLSYFCLLSYSHSDERLQVIALRAVGLRLIQRQSYADVLQNKCFHKFHNIHRKTPALGFLFNKVAGLY